MEADRLMIEVPIHEAVRYVVPLREGGSLPAVLETESGEYYVTKFRGAGQGARALMAELIVGMLGRHLGLPVPGLALINLDDSFGRTERDPEIQDILKGSRGLNVGMRYLEGALNFDPLATAPLVTPDFAEAVIWLDAFTTNIDRTARNPNMMLWNGTIQLIDHGAALYFHHDWEGLDETRIHTPFSMIKNHVLLPQITDLGSIDTQMVDRLNRSVFEAILDQIPDALLMDAPEGRTPPFASAEANRAAYVDYLMRRLNGPRSFVEEAVQAKEQYQAEPPKRLRYRR